MAVQTFKIAKLQKDLNGFMAFITFSFEPNNTLMQLKLLIMQ